TSGLTPFSGPQTRGATFADPLLRPLHKLFSTDSFLSTERRRAGALLRRHCWSGEMKAARVPRALIRYASVQGGLLSRQQLAIGEINRHRLVTLVKHRELVHVTRNVYDWPGARDESTALQARSEYDLHRIRSAWMGLLSAEGSVAT